jgi:hypothetical protein
MKRMTLCLAIIAALTSSAEAAVIIEITPDPLPQPVFEVEFAVPLAASGGSGPYWFGLTAGRLPQGVSFTDSGVFSGFPLRSGPVAFNLVAIDSNGRASTLSANLDVDTGEPHALAQAYPAFEDSPLPITLDATDMNDAALDFDLVPGAPPQHGTLSGTPPNLVYQPDTDFNGTDTFSYTASDADDTSEPAQVTITLQAVNDPPQFAGGPDIAVLAGTTPVVRANWAAVTSNGAVDETAQTTHYVITGNTRPTLFNVPPAIAADGTLTFTPNGNVGVASLSYELRDDGGTANGGDDSSEPQFFTIAIQAPGTDLSVHVDGPDAFVDAAMLQFTVRIDNAGPTAASAATVDVGMPIELTDVQWTCAPLQGASCNAAGSGDIADAINLPANTSLTYTVTAMVAANGAQQFSVAAQGDAGSGQVDPDPTDNQHQHLFRVDALFNDGFED